MNRSEYQKFSKEINGIVGRWLTLWNRFSVRFGNKATLGEIIREMKKFAKEENLDDFDVKAILTLTFGEEAGAFIYSVYVKSCGVL